MPAVPSRCTCKPRRYSAATSRPASGGPAGRSRRWMRWRPATASPARPCGRRSACWRPTA
ncbi:Uncharacterised protein [Bordetella pertussis]|nr:Uncharacterised protein [Bordetella pertussis]